MSISFCTTCRNRLYQLKQTLPYNLERLTDNSDICLVDYGSTDEISDWVWSELKNYIYGHKLIFFEVKNSVNWHMAKAKNLAHRISNKEYLFSLDADNYLSENDLVLIKRFAESSSIVHQFSGDWEDGSCGRIGLASKLFYDLGGYDESFLPMGAEDIDIKNRAEILANSKAINIGSPEIQSIKHPSSARMAEVILESDAVDSDWDIMNRINLNYSEHRIKYMGATRVNNFSSYFGLLNGREIIINGL